MQKLKKITLVVTLVLVASLITGCTFIEGLFGRPTIRIREVNIQTRVFNEGDIFDRNSIELEFSNNGSNNWEAVNDFTFHPATPLTIDVDHIIITYRGLTLNHNIIVQGAGTIPDCPPDCEEPCCYDNGNRLVSISLIQPAATIWRVGEIPTAHGRTFSFVRYPADNTTPITWHSSNHDFATVAPNGTVVLNSMTAVGYTDITARGGGIISSAVRIRVEPMADGGPPLTGLNIAVTTERHWVMGVEHSLYALRRTIPLTRTPSTALGADVTWASTNEDVATINAHGEVTLVGRGYTYISASSGSVSSNAIRINVTQPGYNSDGQLVVLPREGPCNRARGLGYGFGGGTAVGRMNALSSGENPVSWFYNWSNTAPSGTGLRSAMRDAGVRYVPMHQMGSSFGAGAQANVRNFVLEQRALGHEVRYLRTLNEVNITGQGAMLPEAHVSGPWVGLLQTARELDLKLVSPTVAHGNVSGTLAGPNGEYTGEMGGTNWIVSFLRGINNRNNPERYGTIHDLHAIAVNTYTSWPSHFSIFAERPRVAVQREFDIDIPIWVTEWAAWYYPFWAFDGLGPFGGTSRTRADQIRWQTWHMSQGIAWMEQSSAVDKYAWYHVSRTAGNAPSIRLMDGTTLLETGIVYTNASTFDSNYWIDISNGRIGAASRVTRNNVSEWVNNPLDAAMTNRVGFREGVNFFPTRSNDSDAFALDLNDLGRYNGGATTNHHNKWIEYQIYVPEGYDGNFRLDMRANSPFATNIVLEISGRTIDHSFVAQSAWQTSNVNLGHLTSGRHILRITGTTNLRGPAGQATMSGWPYARSNNPHNLSLNWLEFVRI